MALHVLAYNLTRVINIIGPGRLIAAIRIWTVAMRLSPDAMYLALAVTRRGLLSSLMPHSFDRTETRSRSRRRGLIRQF
jgi:hypothetical protein